MAKQISQRARKNFCSYSTKTVFSAGYYIQSSLCRVTPPLVSFTAFCFLGGMSRSVTSPKTAAKKTTPHCRRWPYFQLVFLSESFCFGLTTTSLCILSRCATDNTVKFIPTVDERTQRFRLEAFKFLGDHQFVYMHCKVKICNATDPNSRCAQGCLHDRRRRSLYTQETNDEEYNLAQGPFMRSEVEDDETEMTGTRDVENSGKFHFTSNKTHKQGKQIFLCQH